MFGFHNPAKAGSCRFSNEGALEFGESQRCGRAGADANQSLANTGISIKDEIRRNHNNGNNQIPPRPQLEKRGDRILNAPGNTNRSEKLVGPPCRLAIAKNELAERERAGSVAGRKNQFSVESKQRGDAVRGRRSVAQIAGDRGRILDLHGANFARGGLEAVETAGKRSGENFAPGCSSAEHKVFRGGLNPPDFGKPRYIQHRPEERPVAKRGENIRAPGKDSGAGVCKNVQGILKRVRTKVQKTWLPMKQQQ